MAQLSAPATRTRNLDSSHAALNGHRVKIRASNLSFYYGRFRALNDVSLSIAENKITAMIGPSGCGKSTLLHTFNRMYDLTPGARVKGSIRLDHEEITTLGNPQELRRRVGMVFQRANPFPMSIYDNVAYGPRLMGWSKPAIQEAVEDSLRVAGLWDDVSDRLHRAAASMSGGQQQRLCIARAIAVQPEVLLLDEPTAALDPISTLRVEETLQALREKYCIVMVTHNLQQAARVSNVTGFMYLGELVEIGLSSEIFTSPKNRKTDDYITGRFG